MLTLGVYLKNSREAQNISLKDVADYTKISKVYLDCLEKDEYTKIPAKPYVKGYISSYASFVGIDENEALELYDSFQKEGDDTDVNNAEILQNQKNALKPYRRIGKKLRLVFVFCILSIVSTGTYYLFFQNQTETKAKISPGEKDKPLQTVVNSTPKIEVPQNNPDNNYFSHERQTDFDEKIENGEVRENHNNGVSQNPVSLTSLKPETKSNEAATDTPINEVSIFNDLPGAEIDRTIIEDNLTAIEVTAGTGIKNRVPQGIGDTFDWSTDRIYIWSRIACENPPSSIRHIYYFNGRKVNDVVLSVRSSKWRTWSYKTVSSMRYIGHWRVDVTSAEGKILKRINFQIR